VNDPLCSKAQAPVTLRLLGPEPSRGGGGQPGGRHADACSRSAAEVEVVVAALANEGRAAVFADFGRSPAEVDPPAVTMVAAFAAGTGVAESFFTAGEAGLASVGPMPSARGSAGAGSAAGLDDEGTTATAAGGVESGVAAAEGEEILTERAGSGSHETSTKLINGRIPAIANLTFVSTHA